MHRKQIDFEPGEDGSFWMSLDTFLRIFDDVYTVPFWNGQEGKIFVDVERGEWIEETSGGSGAAGVKPGQEEVLVETYICSLMLNHMNSLKDQM